MAVRRFRVAIGLVVGGFLLAACTSEPPSWPRLIEARITSQYPGARVQTGAQFLQVELGGRTHQVEIAPLILQCNRGHADCERAMTDMLLEIGKGSR